MEAIKKNINRANRINEVKTAQKKTYNPSERGVEGKKLYIEGIIAAYKEGILNMDLKDQNIEGTSIIKDPVNKSVRFAEGYKMGKLVLKSGIIREEAREPLTKELALRLCNELNNIIYEKDKPKTKTLKR